MAAIARVFVIQLGKQPFCNHKTSHFKLSYAECNNSHLGHCFALVSYCFIKDVYIWIACKCSIWKTESKVWTRQEKFTDNLRALGAINNEQAKKLFLLPCFKVCPGDVHVFFFQSIDTASKTTDPQITKYAQVLPSFQRCSVLQFSPISRSYLLFGIILCYYKQQPLSLPKVLCLDNKYLWSPSQVDRGKLSKASRHRRRPVLPEDKQVSDSQLSFASFFCLVVMRKPTSMPPLHRPQHHSEIIPAGSVGAGQPPPPFSWTWGMAAVRTHTTQITFFLLDLHSSLAPHTWLFCLFL